MKRNIRHQAVSILVAVAGALALGGCSYMGKVPVVNKLVGTDDSLIHDHKPDYLKAQTIPRTKVPAGFSTQVIDDLLVIPDLPGENKKQAFLDPPLPRPVDAKSDREVVIQRMNNNSWIVADASPAQVWPRIRDYWRKNNVQIASENPTSGLMETGWFVLAGNVTTQEKFRVMIEPGFQDNSAEIHLLQIEAPQSTPVIGAIPFKSKSMNPDTEYAVLTSMSSFLADVADLYQTSTVSFLAAGLSGTGRAALASTPGGNEVLQLKADYERSWAALGRALKRAKINVVAEDYKQGFYDLVYVPGQLDDDEKKEEKKGFFRKIWTLGGLLGSGNKQSSYSLRLQVLQAKDSVEVLVSPKMQPVKDVEAQGAGNELLELLRSTIA